MSDFLDNLGAHQYEKMHEPKKIKITLLMIFTETLNTQ